MLGEFFGRTSRRIAPAVSRYVADAVNVHEGINAGVGMAECLLLVSMPMLLRLVRPGDKVDDCVAVCGLF